MGGLRAPVATITLNGGSIPGLIDFQVCSSSHFAADRFRVRFALGACGSTIWSQPIIQLGVEVEISGSTCTLITGLVDHVEIDVVHGEVVVDGRDLSSRLLVGRT